MNFELTILGSNSALPTSHNFSTAQVLNVHERFFLIDCGEGTQMQLRRLKVKFSRIDHIFISHLHGDHIFGIFGLLSTFNLLGRVKTLHVYGPAQIDEIVTFFLGYFAEKIRYKIEVHKLEKRELTLLYTDKVVSVFAFPLRHRVPTFGYLFAEKEQLRKIRKDKIEGLGLSIPQIHALRAGRDIVLENGESISNNQFTFSAPLPRKYAYCSDTAYYPKLIDYIKGVDLLYHEATFLNEDLALAKQTGHSTATQAATIARDAEVTKLLLGHFSSRYADRNSFVREATAIFTNSQIVADGDVISIPRNLTPQHD